MSLKTMTALGDGRHLELWDLTWTGPTEEEGPGRVLTDPQDPISSHP